MSFTNEQRNAAKVSARATIEARKALRAQSADGWLIYHDSPPGIGWVLAPPATASDGSVDAGAGHRLRYFADREMCLVTYRRLTGRDFAPVKTP